MTNDRPDKITRLLIDKLLAERMPQAGSYAYAVAYGEARLSGADLQGKAARYGSSYARTRARVVALLRGAGLARERIGAHGRRYLEFDQ